MALHVKIVVECVNEIILRQVKVPSYLEDGAEGVYLGDIQKNGLCPANACRVGM